MVKKHFFAVLCAVVVVALSVVPCFAQVDANNNWESYTTTSPYVAIPTSQLTANTYSSIIDLVDKAYALGLFGGQYPVAITGYLDNTLEVHIYCVGAGHTSDGQNRIKDRAYYSYLTSNVLYFGTSEGSTIQCTRYSLAQDGLYSTTSMQNKVTISTTLNGSKVIATRGVGGTWTNLTGGGVGATVVSGNTIATQISAILTTYNNMLSPPPGYTAEEVESMLDEAYNEGYTQGYYDGEDVWWQGGYDIGYDEGFDQGWTNGYDMGYETGYGVGYDVGIEDGSPTVLNIPSIFDSMFSGVRSIMGAFDIEIFGINIIGTLVAVLVIAIIAFVVRKLWK